MQYEDWCTKSGFSGGHVLPVEFDQEDRTDWRAEQHRQISQSDQEEFDQEEFGFTELCFE